MKEHSPCVRHGIFPLDPVRIKPPIIQWGIHLSQGPGCPAETEHLRIQSCWVKVEANGEPLACSMGCMQRLRPVQVRSQETVLGSARTLDTYVGENVTK
jgi:hypothetical protein